MRDRLENETEMQLSIVDLVTKLLIYSVRKKTITFEMKIICSILVEHMRNLTSTSIQDS